MPGLNGTGPRGMGAMTGGARGYCVTSRSTGPFVGQGRRFLGQGRGCGMGRGHGWRSMNTSNSSPQQDMAMLKEQAAELKDQLAMVQDQIETFERSQQDENK